MILDSDADFAGLRRGEQVVKKIETIFDMRT